MRHTGHQAWWRPELDDLIFIIDLVGVFVFAVSGALAAIRKSMDMFGVAVLALMPAIGGGTIRDVTLGQPVFWVQDTLSIWVALAAAMSCFFFARFIESRMRFLTWADAVGLSLFCVTGAEKAFAVSGSVLVAAIMGVVTGVAGGIIRDVICNEIPIVMRRGEIYATAAFVGAGAFCLLLLAGVPETIAVWSGMAGAFFTRAGGILRGWSLPTAK